MTRRRACAALFALFAAAPFAPLGAQAPAIAPAQAPAIAPAPSPAASPAAPPLTPEAQVRAAMQGFMDALNALDTDGMAAWFAEDVTAFVPTAKAGYVDGKPELTEIFRAFVAKVKPTTPRLHLVPENERVQVSGDLAVVTFEIREPQVTRRRTFVFRRQGDRWLISHMHASDLAPPPQRQ